MKKLFWLLPLAMLFACGPSTPELVPPETNVNANTAVSPTNDTNNTDEANGETETGEAAPPAAAPPDAANLGAFQPASSIPEAAVVRDQDWREGASDPLIVIIEYGDFQ
ncbi:MAG: hypothetical protein WAS33_08205 [Candidatus Promineifilaceae bacterium]|nr:hypothetical protein [Anaerolineaceae bacterium]